MRPIKGITGLLACLLAVNVAQAQIGPPPGEEDSANSKSYPSSLEPTPDSKKSQTEAEKLEEEARKKQQRSIEEAMKKMGEPTSNNAGKDFKSDEISPEHKAKVDMLEKALKEEPLKKAPKKASTGGNFSTGNVPTVVCDGKGGFRVEMNGHDNSEYSECMAKHEYQHIRDWLELCPDACKGKSNGEFPPMPDSKSSPESVKAMAKACPDLRDAVAYTSFITGTECHGYNVEFWCVREKTAKLNKEGKAIGNQLKRGDMVLNKYHYNYEMMEKYRDNKDWADKTKAYNYFNLDVCRFRDAKGDPYTEAEAEKVLSGYWERRNKAKSK